MLVLLVVSSYPLMMVGASSTPHQYQSNITVDYISVNGPSGGAPSYSLILLSLGNVPVRAGINFWPVGTVLEIVFRVVYLTGEPVTLHPQKASFGLSNSIGMFKKLINVTVATMPKGPGWYNYNFTVASDFPTGPAVVSVLSGSLHDLNMNSGPTADINSDITFIPSDYSKIEIGIPTSTPPPSQPSYLSYASYDVPLLIAALLVIALLLVALRSRKKRK